MVSVVDLTIASVVLLCSCWAFVRMVEARGYWGKDGKRVPGPCWRFPSGDRFDFYLRPETTTREYFKRFGSVYRIFHWIRPMLYAYRALQTLQRANGKCRVIADESAAEAFYSDQMKHTRPRNLGFGYPFEPILGECMGAAAGSDWTRIKRVFAPGFRGVQSLLPKMVEEATLWVQERQTSDAVNVLDEIASYPFAVVAFMIYGPISAENMVQLQHLGRLHCDILEAVLRDPWSKIPGYQFLPTALNSTVHEFVKGWEVFNENRAAELACNGNGAGLFQHLAPFVAKEVEDERFKKACLHTMTEVLFANFDVVSSVLSWAVANLAQYEGEQALLREEKQELLGERPLNEISLREVSSMHQLDCFVKESARKNPIIGLTMPEELTADLTVDCLDVTVPAGTMTCIDMYSLNHNPDLWESPDEFLPERFASKPRRFTYDRFGLGARQCPGGKIGDLLTKVLLLALLEAGVTTLVGEVTIARRAPIVSPNAVVKVATSATTGQ